MQTSDFDFALPPELIAQAPLPERSASRLLQVGPEDLVGYAFRDLPDLLSPGDLLVLNDTRVIRARLRGHRESGGRIEVLIERVIDERTVVAQLRASKKPQPGSRLWIASPTSDHDTRTGLAVGISSAPDGLRGQPDQELFGATMIEREGEFFVLRFDADVQTVLDQAGELPLPPYINRPPERADENRYQTVFAAEAGAVAAPTAGLHFDERLLKTLQERGIRLAWLTLQVGAGTFQPVRVTNVSDHVMHRERYTIPAATVAAIEQTRMTGGKVIAVGTTSLRALESCAREHGRICAGSSETRLFLKPGDRFAVIDRLITNFHLPRSTLMMLVCAFAGTERIRAAYSHAIAQRYRFFSYGDAMLLDLASPPDTA